MFNRISDMLTIDYKINQPISAQQFIDLLEKTTLGVRRPLSDRSCMQGMVENANLMVTAWIGERLVGVARSVTDFYYCCYLSDLAVDQEYQKCGIGKRLIELTEQQLKPSAKLILLAAPAANEYYPTLGFEHNPRAWVK
jgi:GNAT superfamily N-acetyltransferase